MSIIINMPPKAKIKFVCTDRTPLIQGEIRDRPGRCFEKGLKAGFAAGLRKGQAGQQPAGQPPQPPPAPPAQGDIYDFIDQFVQGLIPYNPVQVNFQAPPAGPQVQVAPPMQIPPAPVLPIFQPIEEEPVPAPMPEQPELPEPRVKPKGRREKFRKYYGLDKEKEKKPINRKISAATLKNVLGKPLYKQFITKIREGDRKPQETYDKFGIRELKILANIMTDNLDLSVPNRDILTNVINDKKVQGNKSLIKNLMDSVINSLA